MSALVNVAELMSDPDFASAIIIKRPRGDFDDAGIYQTLDYEAISAVGIVQPASPEVIKAMDEGERTTEMVEIWSATQMRKSDSAGTMSDVIEHGGSSYRVVKAENWLANGYSYAVAEAFLPPVAS